MDGGYEHADGRQAARVAVIGTGYVGLTTGACLAHLGHEVVCADIDTARVEELSQGRVPIVELGLEELVVEGIESGRLRFTTSNDEAVDGAGFHFMCLPTPQGEDGAADLSYLRAAAAGIAGAIPSGSVVVNKSTVPVGTSVAIAEILGRPDVHVASNPEFLREGSAVGDFLHPDRIVVGAADADAARRVAALYAAIDAPVITTDPASAEVIKYASNAYLASKLSFVNSVANLCEAVGADVTDVLVGMGYDARIGSTYLQPGPGWGGSCFPKDTLALIRIAADAGFDFDFLRAAIHVNDAQLERTARKVVDALDGSVNGRRLAAWGLTFKAGTDDLRESPAIAVLQRLAGAGAIIRAFDPAIAGPVSELPHAEIVADPYEAAEGADVLVVLTEWDDFRRIDVDKLAGVMSGRSVVDARNILDRELMQANGFTYRGIGR